MNTIRKRILLILFIKKSTLVFIHCLLFFCAFHAAALDPEKKFHQYVLDEWSLEEGLPQISVGAITQGKNGYIWVGTQAGLARFDGARFTTFSPDNTPAMKGNYIRSLFNDSYDRLWIGTYKGLVLYTNSTFSFIELSPDNRQLKTALIDVNGISEDNDGRIIVASNEGTWQVTKQGLSTYAQLHQQASHSVLTYNETVYIGGTGKVWRVKQDKAETIPLPQGSRSAKVSSMVQTEQGIMLGTSKGMYVLRNDKITPFESKYALDVKPIDALLRDGNENLWVGSISGLYRIRDGQVVEMVSNDNPATFQQVLALFEDREGSLWLGSYRHGVARVWDGRTKRYNSQEGLHEDLTWSVAMAEDDESVWVGTNDGLSLLKDGRYKQIVAGEKLPHPTAYTLLVEPNRVWIGTRSGAALWQDNEITFPAPLSQMSSFQVNAIFRASDDRLWFATTGGVFVYDDESLKRIELPNRPSYSARFITESSKGEILVGTQKGLFVVNQFELSSVGLDSGLIQDIDVSSIHELDDGRLILSTISRGLFVKDENTWHNFTESDGLPVNESFYVTSDSFGYLWVSGYKGLYRLPISDFQAYLDKRIAALRAEMLLSESGGIIGSQKAFCCNGAGRAKGLIHDGVLWYPTRGGAISIDTKDIRTNPVPPPVRIERVRFNNKWHQINNGQQLTLPANARDIIFEYTALSFQDPKSVRFQYMLVGYDQTWQTPEHTNQRNVAYTNLPAGDYTLLVKGANNAGVWNPKVARLPFSITPLFYETWWFYFIIIFLLSSLIYWWHRRRINTLKAQRRRLEKEVSLRTSELSIANERLLEAIETLNETSQTDPLTGLKNRRYLVNQLPSDLAHFCRELVKLPPSDDALVFVLLDIDHFKKINDNYGHKAGDDILQQFAQIISDNIRKGDYGVRWGGEEFVIVFRPMPFSVAPQIIDRMRKRIEAYQFKIEGQQPIKLTCSIGFAEYPFFREEPQFLSWEHTIELADLALYQVKENGRNGWACFRPSQHTVKANLINSVQQDVDKELAMDRLKLHSSWNSNENS